MSIRLCFVLVIAAVAASVILACGSDGGPSLSKESREVADVFHNSLGEFDVSRNNVGSEVRQVTQNASQYLGDTATDLSDIGDQWEAEWRIVGIRIDLLEVRLSAVAAASVSYFGQLDYITGQINDPVTRTQEETKNNTARGEWTLALEEATGDIQALRNIQIKGQDFHKVIVLGEIRSDLAANRDVVRSISEAAKSLLEELRRLTEEGERILSAV